MNRLRYTPLLLVVLLSGAAPLGGDTEALLRAGDAAVGRGDYQAAVANYACALERTTDPAPAAFNLAAARLHLAREGPPEERLRQLREAELLFGSFTSSANPRKARALYGLGVCQLQRAEAGDPAAARTAVLRLRECLTELSEDAPLTQDVQHNLARARMLALQLPPPPPESDSKQEPSGDGPKDPPRPDRAPNEKAEGTGSEKQPVEDAGASQEEGTVKETNARNPRGKAGPPTLPDRNQPTPLTPGDAAVYLEKARRALRADREQQRRLHAASPSLPGVRDW